MLAQLAVRGSAQTTALPSRWRGWVGGASYDKLDFYDKLEFAIYEALEPVIVWPWEPAYAISDAADPSETGILTLDVDMAAMEFERIKGYMRKLPDILYNSDPPVALTLDDGNEWSKGTMDCVLLGRVRDSFRPEFSSSRVFKANHIIIILGQGEKGIYHRRSICGISKTCWDGVEIRKKRVQLG